MSAAAGVTTPLMSTTADTKSTDPFVAHSHVQSSKHEQHRKVSIVGAGAVGMAIAVSIINQNLCSELTLIDIDTKKVSAEILDLQHGMGAAKMPVVVNGGSDITLTRHSNVCIVAAGVRQRVGESRRDLLNRNAELLAPIIRELARLSPKTILLMVSNPVDVMTYLAWKVSGFPASRVVGSGTTLDSSRFRNLLSKRLNVPVTSAHAYVIGEHGDMSVPVWSSVNVFGTQLRYLYPKAGTPNDPDRFNEISGQIVRSAADLIAAKGYTSWYEVTSCLALCVTPRLRLNDDSCGGGVGVSVCVVPRSFERF